MPAAGVQYLGGDKSPADVSKDKLTGIDYQYSSVLSKKPEWVEEAHACGITVNCLDSQHDGRHDGLHRIGSGLHHHGQPCYAEKTAGHAVRLGSEIN